VKKLRVGVIYGGRSGEHEVSLASAAAVFQNLDPERYDAIPIRINKDGRWVLPSELPARWLHAHLLSALSRSMFWSSPGLCSSSYTSRLYYCCECRMMLSVNE